MTRVALLLAIFSTVARAAPPDTTEPDDLRRARTLYEQGSAAYSLNRYDEALARFEESYVLSQRPALLYNIALCQEHLFRWEQAAKALRHYLASDPQVADREELLRKAADLEMYAKMARAPAAATAPAPVEESRRVPWLMTGAAAAVAVAAASLTIAAAVDFRDLALACGAGGSGCTGGARGQLRSLDIAADVLWATAAVAAAVATAAHLLHRSNRSLQRSNALVPTANGLRFAF